ncbi:MAG TPA: succinate dehydrogenase cytochrome b subunit [Gemmatimonadaceae bacterium]|nr:succinate dehydrogenase cytochrome b subunit [Gemmatimonadaceae bacterium]
MSWFVNLYRSTIGKKIIMAVTGLIGIAFVVLHMVGNLQVFIGQDKFDAYAALLHGPLAEVLWVARAVLVAAVLLHVLMAWQLTQRAHAARPVDYRMRQAQVSTLASRTMRWGGVLLLAFIVFHILHFTVGTIDPAGVFHTTDAAGRHDIYGDVVASFRIWWVSGFYLLSMAFLGLHLFHGAWSSLRTLGVARPSEHPLHRRIAAAVAIAVWLGFTLVPLGVIAGIVH